MSRAPGSQRCGLLVTGFGPFPGMPVNPSAALARCLGSDPRVRLRLGGRVRALVLPTAYRSIPEILAPALAEGPEAVLMLGVASRARRLRVEVRSANRASRLHPDASGRAARSPTLEPGGPKHRSGAAPARALAALRRCGLPARMSNDAGRYLCNAAFHRALAEPCPVLFVHVPPAPRVRRPRPPGSPPRGARRREPIPTLAAQARGLAAVAALLLAVARGRAGSRVRAA